MMWSEYIRSLGPVSVTFMVMLGTLTLYLFLGMILDLYLDD